MKTYDLIRGLTCAWGSVCIVTSVVLIFGSVIGAVLISIGKRSWHGGGWLDGGCGGGGCSLPGGGCGD